MEGKFTDIAISNKHRVSPYQILVNNRGKKEVISSYSSVVWLIWAAPLALTFAEIVLLKHNHAARADKVGLFKFISYIVATGVSFYSLESLIYKLNYYNRLYPHPPQYQKEAIRDAEILKATENL